MRLGWFRPVHCKSLPAQEVRALLATRKLLRSCRADRFFVAFCGVLVTQDRTKLLS
jgi:hypothetical protein